MEKKTKTTVFHYNATTADAANTAHFLKGITAIRPEAITHFIVVFAILVPFFLTLSLTSLHRTHPPMAPLIVLVLDQLFFVIK